jgi:ABC-type lipoprotein export system ATPase subunit
MNHLLRLSDRSLHAAATFGNANSIDPSRISDKTLRTIADLAADVSITLILGPSGAGKSRLLRNVASNLVYRGLRTMFITPNATSSRSSSTAVDLIPGPVTRVRELLGSCGLADVRTFTRASGLLSVGETFRLLIARALAREPDALLIDEFGGSLDSETLISLCHSWKRSNRPTKLIVAGVNPTLRDILKPDVIITCNLGSDPNIEITKVGER